MKAKEVLIKEISNLPSTLSLWAAPMVRISTLPFRLVCLDYGAQRVFSPELVDKALLDCSRRESHDCINYINSKGSIVFQTIPREKQFLTVQLGSSDAELALKAALMIQNDCTEINLNCGCPKRFSIQAGMGAALLNDVDKLCHILKTLVNSIQIPVSAKIRLLENVLEDPTDTISLLRRIQETGINHLIIHLRRPSDRPESPALWDILRLLLPYKTIPWILNGDLFTLDRCREAQSVCGVSSFMIARAAMLNPSVFSSKLCSPSIISSSLINYGIKYSSHFTMMKYSLMQMWPNVHHYPKLLHSRNYEELLEFIQAVS